CGWVGSKNETVLFDFLLQFIQDKTRLNPRQLALHVNLEHAVHVLREINDHRDVAALSRQARPAAATGDRRAELAAGRNGGYDIAAVARDHHTDWNLAIIRAVGRIKSAIAIAEAHFATDSGAQCALERAGINLSDVRQRDIFLHQRVSTPDPCRAATDQDLNARWPVRDSPQSTAVRCEHDRKSIPRVAKVGSRNKRERAIAARNGRKAARDAPGKVWLRARNR